MQDRLITARAALEAGDLDAAFRVINEALSEGDARADMIGLFGDALHKAGMTRDAAGAFEMAAKAAGASAFPYWKKAALAYDALGDGDQALAAAIKAQTAQDGDPDIIFLLARQFHARGERDLLGLVRNRLTASDDPRHLNFAAELISGETRNPFNLPLFKKLAALRPDDDVTQAKLMAVAREFCDYDTIEAQERWMEERRARLGDAAAHDGETPYANLLHCGDESRNRLAANRQTLGPGYSAERAAARRALPHVWNERLRIGYFSNDFSSTHATMRLMREVLERHDRSRFDITLYCYTPDDLIRRDDGGRSQWGRIVSVGSLADADIAERMRADGVDILVDLKGHTGGSRSHVLNFPIAPVQIGWLGYPGSTQMIDLDYVIGDRFVLPDAAKPHYHEKFIRLPHSYQPNDAKSRPQPTPLPRAALGLPEDRFLFASFNANRKITLETLKLWAEILKATPGSLLWILLETPLIRDNFAARMEKEGVARDRLIFADNAEYAAHLARAGAADLHLDTFPYNGHTTTSDMLWAGVPTLTKKGSNFASRVSESLLNAVGLPDLVMEDRDAFVEMAVEFALNPARLKSIRHRLAEARKTAPLFDAERFCRSLERAYSHAAARARQRLAPDHLDLF
ncbi:glycosyl transferase [Rhizobium sp. FKL33]|uniref:O-linked N-acetylglucosamine transferase, SPINDLY family protein n=1 Tax=Rhizobium sp. FKL33 TaxID=2562307 RepID=UPI0010C099CB|nr:glycosyl transferase [Rhizobium sp. FKL33]